PPRPELGTRERPRTVDRGLPPGPRGGLRYRQCRRAGRRFPAEARPRTDPAEANLAAAVGAPATISGTTPDGLGFTGRDEGLAAIATALIAAEPAAR